MKYAIVALALALAIVPGVQAEPLLHDDRGDYAVSVNSIETKDFGVRGVITSLEVTIERSPDDVRWQAYDLRLQVGRTQGDYFGNNGQGLYKEFSLRNMDADTQTLTFDLVPNRPLSITSFDEEQHVSVSLWRQRNPVAHASGVFDLGDFAN